MMAGIAWQRRLVVCLAVGALVASRTYYLASNPADPPDFQQVWYAARAMLDGGDPYALIGPGRAFPFEYRLVYPLTAAVAALPFAPLSARWACTLFFALGATVFAWALTRRSWGPLLGAGSAAMLFAAEEAQWSPVLAAALALPPLGILFAAKPTVSAAIFAARPNWWSIAGGGALLAVSLLMQPAWPLHWWQAITSSGAGAPAPYLAPVRLPFGVLALLCLIRWRRPEARLVAVLACVPQTGLLYETVPLFLVPRSFAEATVLTGASYGVLWWMRQQVFHNPAAYLEASGRAITLALYLPATIIVLRRPNRSDDE